MPNGDFVWCNLSAFNIDRAKHFCAELLGWRFTETAQPDGAPYWFARTPAGECAASFLVEAQ